MFRVTDFAQVYDCVVDFQLCLPLQTQFENPEYFAVTSGPLSPSGLTSLNILHCLVVSSD
jgi:hypothetical protein